MRKDPLSPPRPNEHLKQERLLRGWSQVYIANALMTDAYTVNRWERGRSQPSPYFRQKLCELFGKNTSDLGLLSFTTIPSLPGAPSTSIRWKNYMTITFPRNPYFTGREATLQTLHTYLTTTQTNISPSVIALSGLGGVGKTQIALEYSYRYATTYTAIFWIDAENMETISASMQRIATILELPIKQPHSIAAIRHWLTIHSQWLLIWDNLGDPEWLLNISLPTRQGSTLITTRRQTCGTVAQSLQLAAMEQEEGILFLLRRTRILDRGAGSTQVQHLAISNPKEYSVSSELVTLMGRLPLALDQAGTYIDESGCSLTNYLQLYQKHSVSLLGRRGILNQNHTQSVTATFLYAYKCVERTQKLACTILCICSLLHVEAIPEELFIEGARYLELEPISHDLTLFDQAIAILRNLSLLQRHPENRTLSIHCLVKTVIQGQMNQQERSEWTRRIAIALNALFPDSYSNTWRQGERLLPHVLTVISGYPNDSSDKNLVALLEKSAGYLQKQTQSMQSEVLSQQAYSVNAQLSKIHSSQVILINNYRNTP